MLRWLSQKYSQISFLLENETLKSAVTAPIREPIEGAKLKVGDKVHVADVLGSCRNFQVYGIQSGGFSNVYSVIDSSRMEAFCIKASRSGPAEDSEYNAMLAREANIWLRLGKHPNIVAIQSVFYFKSQLHLQIEFIDGESLSSIRKNSILELKRVLQYAIQLARALNYCQLVIPGFVHGDIKPGNCLITKNGVLKLTDFGLAFSTCQKTSTHENPTNELSDNTLNFLFKENRGGTSAYMPPEKFTKDLKVSAASDAYSFGVALFELLSGRRPFEGPTDDDFSFQHLNDAPPIFALENRGIPSELIELVSKCLEKNPSDRLGDFYAIENRLLDIYRSEFDDSFSEEIFPVNTAIEIADRASSFAVLGDNSSAKHCSLEALRICSGNAEIWARHSFILATAEEFHQAEQSSLKALSIDSNSEFVLFTHAKVLWLLGNLEDSIIYAEKVLKINPNNWQALNLMGVILLKSGALELAAKQFTRSIRVDSLHSETYLHLANLNISLKKYTAAKKYAEKAFTLNDKCPNISKCLGDICFGIGDFRNAISHYNSSLSLGIRKSEIKESFVSSCVEFAKLVNRKPNEMFIEILNRSCESNNSNRKTDLIRGILNLAKAEYYDPVILFLFEQIIVDNIIDLDDKQIQLELKKTLVNTFLKAEHENQLFDPYYAIGKLFYVLEQFEECNEIFKTSLAKLGPNEKTYYYLAACAEVSGDFASSALFYERALQINRTCELNKTGKQRMDARVKTQKREISKSINPDFVVC